MKFVVGLLTEIIVGAVGAVAYSVQTGRDLREEFEGVRGELSRGDFDALGTRLESRVTELQTQLEARISEIKDKAQAAADDGAASLNGATNGVASDAADAVAGAAEGAGEALGEAKGTVESAVEDATEK